MRYSQVFAKTSKSMPHDADSVNAKLLVQGGFVHQEMAGVYSWLPFGLRVLRKVENIIRQEMNALGAQELLMSALQPKEHWLQTGRWDSVDVLFKLPSQTKKEYALGPTHEEIVTPLIKAFLSSYKELPFAVYQIQTKFRDELRAKSGVMRGREFGMKDMYSFHATREDFDAFYEKVKQAYFNVFSRCGVQAHAVEASGGAFTKKFSHEFQVLSDAGEDLVAICPKGDSFQNSEIAQNAGGSCPVCGSTVEYKKGIEVGNIFDLGTKFAEDFDLQVTSEQGTREKPLMGCYGIGTTRLVGTIVEVSHDARGMIWPKSVAPFQVHLVSLRVKDAEVAKRVATTTQELYESFTSAGVEVLWDDREEVSPGEKFADADLIGIPLRLVVSEKTLKEDSVEWKMRTETEAHLVKLEDVREEVGDFLKE